jgi:S-formylglutathione hydrolase FrmB
MKKLIVLLLILTAIVGCSKRENPVESKPSELGVLWTAHITSASLDSCIIPQVTGRDLYIYTPPGDMAPGETLPILFLLHGYGGDYKYFNTLFDIKNLLDEMITSGEILPMFVILPDADNTFGGSFYTNSPDDPALLASFAGRYESYFINDVMGYIVASGLRADTAISKRGISGHSMGGYGAYRIAMDYPDQFGSVSAMSAPISFRGLLPLMPSVFAENGFTANDTAAFYTIAPSSHKRLTSMMFAMASAFSPHSVTNPDTALFHRLINTSGFVGVDLPFGIDGVIDTSLSSLWSTKWLANDITTRFVLGGSAALANKSLYLDCGDADDLYLQYQNRAFFQIVQTAGLNIRYTEYAGYPGVPGDHTTFVNDRLREVLKFHDAAFHQQ